MHKEIVTFEIVIIWGNPSIFHMWQITKFTCKDITHVFLTEILIPSKNVFVSKQKGNEMLLTRSKLEYLAVTVK